MVPKFDIGRATAARERSPVIPKLLNLSQPLMSIRGKTGKRAGSAGVPSAPAFL